MNDRYAGDVLAGDWRERGRRVVPTVAAERDLVVEVADGMPGAGYVGAVTGVEKGVVELEDRHGARRRFPLGPGFLVDGETVTLAPPRPAAPRSPARTTSGSRVVDAPARARVARASRILVEGRHDAELVEKVWGPDLRVEGVVVEYLEGIDHLVDELRARDPAPGRRIGVLVDHLVAGSKESRIAAEANRIPHVLVVGHPFVDVWQAVKPARLGLERWPVIPRGTDWKTGILDHLGWPHDDREDVARAWQRILGAVRHYADLEPEMLGRVEELIDFTAADR